MNSNRLLELLAKGEVNNLAPAEKHELARLLEDPASRAVVAQKLAGTRQQLADLLGYRAALSAAEPVLSTERLRRLMENIPKPATTESRRAPIIPLRRWLGPMGAVAAIAASIALVFWMRTPHERMSGTIEFGLVANPATMRATTESSTSDLGAGWRITTHQNLGTLDAWANSDLAADIGARIWVDQEAGVIRGVGRQRDGKLARFEQPLETRTPLPDQLRRLAKRIDEETRR